LDKISKDSSLRAITIMMMMMIIMIIMMIIIWINNLEKDGSRDLVL
jgi:competence protein ComGC